MINAYASHLFKALPDLSVPPSSPTAASAAAPKMNFASAPHQAQRAPATRLEMIAASSEQKIELAKGLRCKDMSEVKATVSLPVALAQQVQEQIQAGWFPDLDCLVVEALRRYLESHRDELMEHFIRRDLEWGLQGDD